MDEDVMGRINELVDEEHQLMQRSGRLDDTEEERLRELEVALDQCWDLLRQRRARRHADLDPSDAVVRDANTVEGYEQ